MKKFAPILLIILASCVPWNLAPDCKFVIPEDGEEYAKGEVIEVYVKASDEDGEIVEVRFYLDGIGIASVNVFPFSTTLETADLEVGTHTLKTEVRDDSGKEVSKEVSFVITTGLPIVETLQPVLISENGAIVGGTIIDDGGGSISEAGILWSPLPYDVTGQQAISATVNNDIFTTLLSNLNYITYYVTAYAENEKGRSFGEELSFTVPLPPEE